MEFTTNSAGFSGSYVGDTQFTGNHTQTGGMTVTGRFTLSALALGLLYVNGTGIVSRIADVASGQVLVSADLGGPVYTASPVLTGLTLNGLSASQYVKTDVSKALVSQAGIPLADLLNAGGATGDLATWNGSNWARLADVATGQVLVSGGVGAAPAYSAAPSVTSLAASSFLSSGGGTLSTTGLLRVASAVTAIAGRNAANSADVSLLATDASNNVTFGDAANGPRTKLAASTAVQVAMATPALELGTGSVAASGSIRCANNTTIIAARNAANSGDVPVLSTNGSNDTALNATGGNVNIQTGGTIRLQINASVGILASGVPFVASGASATGIGAFRSGGPQTIIGARNNAANADLNVLDTTAADLIRLNGGAIQCSGTNSIGFFGTAPTTKQAVTGALSTVADAAAKAVLTSILAALATSYGLVTNSTT